jgi:hypothetical protein
MADRRMAQPIYPSSGNTRAFRHLRFAPFSDFDVETLSHVTARRHTDAVDVVLTGASYEAHGCQDNRMASTRRIPPCPLIAGA